MSNTKSSNINVLSLFEDNKLVKICAPMVRYSKLQFRNLVQKYNCDLCFTPMILADSFCKSDKARRNEFTTNLLDVPVITQFAANTVHDFVGAAHMVSPFCNGVDLNCGCPQTWAKQQGLGCALLKNPQLIYDLVRQCRNRISKPFTVSVKMRIATNIRESVMICKQLEKAGVSFLTVHARTSSQLSGDINVNSLKIIRDNIDVPLVANGGVKTLDDCLELQINTNCNGVMVANGILTNPTLFSGSPLVTTDCIQNWLNICYNSTIPPEQYKVRRQKIYISEKPPNLNFQCFHHHLVFMLEKILPKKQRQVFNNLQTFGGVLDFIEDYFGICPMLYPEEQYSKSCILDVDYVDEVYKDLAPSFEEKECDILYDQGGDGKYFESKVRNCREEVCDWSDMFLEND